MGTVCRIDVYGGRDMKKLIFVVGLVVTLAATGMAQAVKYDTDRDGQVTASDALAVLKIAVSSGNTFKVCALKKRDVSCRPRKVVKVGNYFCCAGGINN